MNGDLFVLFSFSDQKIKAEPGGNVSLSRQAPNNLHVIFTRGDLDNNVRLYKEVQVDTKNQLNLDGKFHATKRHSSFENRVLQIKDQNVSFILTNLTINDTGTYKCHVFMEKTRSWKQICSINVCVCEM